MFPNEKNINNNGGQYKFEQDALVAQLSVKSKENLFCLYRVSYNDKETKVLSDKIIDFSYYGRYLCYIDKEYAVHKYDRKTETDNILDSKLKAISINCTSAGMWMR